MTADGAAPGNEATGQVQCTISLVPRLRVSGLHPVLPGSQSFWNYWLGVTKAVSLIPITPTGCSLMIPDRAAYKVR